MHCLSGWSNEARLDDVVIELINYIDNDNDDGDYGNLIIVLVDQCDDRCSDEFAV
jgi:hypothetical protein